MIDFINPYTPGADMMPKQLRLIHQAHIAKQILNLKIATVYKL